jgi:UDP-N-acetylglucosamine 4,6-dehydratase/5-epimerase
MLNGKTILITGGTGSFGGHFVKTILKKYKPRKVIIYSRDEYKQLMMQRSFVGYEGILRFFLGDIRDRSRLHKAFDGVDYVVHAAALKQVPALEYNPTEAVKTNVVGADNIVDAAIEKGVQKVINLSTDKAVNPINLYGATKLVAEKIFVAANSCVGGKVKFSGVRYGNVIGSRGSVIPIFLGLKAAGIKEFPITDPQMTRFWISLDQSVELVIRALLEAEGGEIFVPKIPSMKIKNLAKAIDPECTFSYTGIRPGEKLHESLISDDEARNAIEFNDVYVILPQAFDTTPHAFDTTIRLDKYNKYPALPDGFVLRSDNSNMQLDREELRELIGSLELG